MSDKKIRQKEKFDIEIEKEELNPNQAITQLQNWCKLFESLSKTPKKTIDNANRVNRREITAFRGIMPKKAFNRNRLFDLRNNLRKTYIYY